MMIDAIKYRLSLLVQRVTWRIICWGVSPKRSKSFRQAFLKGGDFTDEEIAWIEEGFDLDASRSPPH